MAAGLRWSLAITLFAIQSASCCDQLSSECYAQLPPIYEYDDFTTCRMKYAEFVYCVATAKLLPDGSNDLWKNISVLTSNRRNFAHDELERALCVNDYFEGVKATGVVRKAVETLLSDSIYTRYGLASRADVANCWTRENFEKTGTTTGELLFIGLSICLIIVTLYATCKDHAPAAEGVLVDAFSIKRNMRRLSKPLDAKTLPFLEGLRAIGMLTILIVHSQLPMIRMPVKNTEDLELQANHFVFPLINSGNTHMIQFFFALGGMVFALSCLNHFESYPTPNTAYFTEKLLRRLIRILPAYGFIIFYQATWYKRVKQGPLEYKFYDYCSEHWWTNIFFLNNYVHPTKPCLQYGWYLGADFHLFLVGSLLLLSIWRFPAVKQAVIVFMVTAAFAVPAYAIYVGSIAATMTFDMRHALAELRTYDHFLKYYLPTHTNLSSYFFGIISALVYKEIVAGKQENRIRSTLARAFTTCCIALLALNTFTIALPRLNIEPAFSLFHALYGSLLKASWGCSYGILFLVLALKGKSLLIDVLSHHILRCLARLSYCIYIVQYSVIYGIYTNFPVPVVYGTFNLVILTSAIALLSLISAVLLHMAVEAPIGCLGNHWLYSLFPKTIVFGAQPNKRQKQL